MKTARVSPLLLLFGLLLFLLPQTGWADIVVLKSGQRFEGEIILETEKEIWLRVPNGQLTLQRKNIKEIIKKKWEEPKKEEEEKEEETAEEESKEEAAESAEEKKRKKEVETLLVRVLDGETGLAQLELYRSGQVAVDLAMANRSEMGWTGRERFVTALTVGREEAEEKEEVPADLDPVPFLLTCWEAEDVPLSFNLAGLDLLRAGFADGRVTGTVLELIAGDLPEEPVALVAKSTAVLGEVGDRESLTGLFPLLSEPPTIRQNLVHAAMKKILIREEGASPTLHNKLSKAVGDLGADEAFRRRAWSLLELDIGASDLALLSRLARSRQTRDRSWAAAGFARLGGRTARRQLEALLDDSDLKVRRAAVQAIRENDRKAFVPDLINLLNANQERLSRAAERALRDLTDQDIDGGYGPWLKWWNEAKKTPRWRRYAR